MDRNMVEIHVNTDQYPLYVGAPDTWGKHYWFLLHTFASLYKLNRSAQAYNDAAWLLYNIHKILPCSSCAEEAFEYGRQHVHLFDSLLADPNLYELYWFDFHNSVNVRIGKPVHRFLPRWQNAIDVTLPVWWYHVDIIIRSCAEDLMERNEDHNLLMDFVELIIRTCPDNGYKMMLSLKAKQLRNEYEMSDYISNKYMLRSYVIRLLSYSVEMLHWHARKVVR